MTVKAWLTCGKYHRPWTFFLVSFSIHYLSFEWTEIILAAWNIFEKIHNFIRHSSVKYYQIGHKLWVITILTRMIQNWTSTPSETIFSWNKYPDFVEKLLFSWGEDFILGLMLRKKPRGIFLCLGRFVSYHMFEIYINVLLNEKEWWL